MYADFLLVGLDFQDWFETHQQEGIRSNIIGTLNCADVCAIRSIHCTTFGTGFLYTYDEAHPKGSGIGFKVRSKNCTFVPFIAGRLL